MARHLETFELDLLALRDAGLLFRYRYLLVHAVHAVEVRQQQAAPPAA